VTNRDTRLADLTDLNVFTGDSLVCQACDSRMVSRTWEWEGHGMERSIYQFGNKASRLIDSHVHTRCNDAGKELFPFWRITASV
jgi:hypothetical protein